MNVAAEKLGTGVFQAEGGLVDAGAAAGLSARPGVDGVLLAATAAGIQKAVEERHTGDADGKALRGLDLGLREFGQAGFVDGDLFGERGSFSRRLGLATCDGQFPAEFADLIGEGTVLLFQAVEALHDLH